MIFNNLRKNITDLINQSGIPIDGVYYILKDILAEVVEVMNQQSQAEQQMAKAAAQEEKSEVKAEETEAAAQIEEKEEK